MKILVTGSTGFIGGALCKELVQRGDQVRAFHRPRSDTRLLDGLPVEHAIGDLSDPQSLHKASRGVEVIFHSAAQLGGANDWTQHLTTTVQGTRTLLEIARHEGVRRFIHTSSVAALGIPNPVYGRIGLPLISETHTGYFDRKNWMYGYAKYLAEMEVQKAVLQGLDAAIVNPASVFGPGDILRRRSSVIHLVGERGLRITASGGMNVVHIRDVIQGHLFCLEYGRTGERYILGGENLTHQAFFQMIRESAGRPAHGLICLPQPIVRGLRHSTQILSHLLHVNINFRILTLAGIHFYYDLEKSIDQLHLPTPLPARQTVADATRWFMEQPL